LGLQGANLTRAALGLFSATFIPDFIFADRCGNRLPRRQKWKALPPGVGRVPSITSLYSTTSETRDDNPRANPPYQGGEKNGPDRIRGLNRAITSSQIYARRVTLRIRASTCVLCALGGVFRHLIFARSISRRNLIYLSVHARAPTYTSRPQLSPNPLSIRLNSFPFIHIRGATKTVKIQ